MPLPTWLIPHSLSSAAVAALAVEAAADFTLVPGFNAVPTGSPISKPAVADCQSHCDHEGPSKCTQFSFNEKSGHCFVSSSGQFVGQPNARVVSGCLTDQIQNCSRGNSSLPQVLWTVPSAPDPSKKMCGFQFAPVKSGDYAEVYHATKETGAYNHAAMMDYHFGNFLLTWKNSPLDEDTPGQRILFSQSTDGRNWTDPTVGGGREMFPNVSSAANPAALFAAPTLVINGRRYAAAGSHQFCLYPDPYPSLLLLRSVSVEIPAQLGPLFWASAQVPAGFEEASQREGIKTLPQMDAQTQSDIATLNLTQRLPCDNSTNTLKCEACVHTCGYPSSSSSNDNNNNNKKGNNDNNKGSNDNNKGSSSNDNNNNIGDNEHSESRNNKGSNDDDNNNGNHEHSESRNTKGAPSVGIGGGQEITHYTIPNTTEEIVLYRTGSHHYDFTYRPNSSANWSAHVATGIPDVDSNLNAGPLPNGQVYLASNPCPGSPIGRDPLVVSTTTDGTTFDQAMAVMSCTTLPYEDDSSSHCGPRIPGKAKGPGPSYPQAVTVVDTGKPDVDGLYVVATNNKEDVWVVRVPLEAFGT